MPKKMNFFKEAIKTIKTSGSLIPSSKFLVKRILKNIDFESAELIVEYGAGNGIITDEILNRLKPSAKLICFEINEVFYKELKTINNPQLVVLNTSAEDIEEEIIKLNFSQVCYVVSSLPLAILPYEVSESIIEKSKKLLKKHGKFIQFQYSTKSLKQFKSFFNKKIVVEFEPLNIPPAFLYVCKK